MTENQQDKPGEEQFRKQKTIEAFRYHLRQTWRMGKELFLRTFPNYNSQGRPSPPVNGKDSKWG